MISTVSDNMTFIVVSLNNIDRAYSYVPKQHKIMGEQMPMIHDQAGVLQSEELLGAGRY